MKVVATPAGQPVAREIRVALLDGAVAVAIIPAGTPDDAMIEWMTMTGPGARYIAGLLMESADNVEGKSE